MRKHMWRAGSTLSTCIAATTSVLGTDAVYMGHRVIPSVCMLCSYHQLCLGGTHSSSTVVPCPVSCTPPHTWRICTPRLVCSAHTRAIAPMPCTTLCHRLGHLWCACVTLHAYVPLHASHSPCPSVSMYMSLVFSKNAANRALAWSLGWRNVH